MSQLANPQNVFAAAERAYVERRLPDARAALVAIAQFRHPAVHHLRAIVERDLGDLAVARTEFEAAVRLAPDDPAIWNNFGSLLDNLGDDSAALAAYDRALSLSPHFGDAAFNRANLLRRLGRLDAARSAFMALIKSTPEDPRFWNGLAVLEMDQGALAAAAIAYDRALAVAPDDRLALIGRARVALERDEPDVRERYRAARRLAPDDRELALDETEGRLARGDLAALSDLADLAGSAPGWVHGQIALARMRWEQGDRDGFADHIEALLRVDPVLAPLWRDYVQLLADCGEPSRAADAAHRASRALGGDESLNLVEAIHAGKAGQIDRAEVLLATLARDVPGRSVHDAVHRIRTGELDRAILCVEAALKEDKWDFAAWGIAELLYRKTGDPRSEWLSGLPGLVSVSQLPLDPADFDAVDSLLLGLHRDTVEAIGQSVQGGSQTRWQLFDRTEPELVSLRAAIERALADHFAALPAKDAAHPLLRHRDRRMKIGPSWSVRFMGAGHHVAHYHPKGLISSACYFRVPPRDDRNSRRLARDWPPPGGFSVGSRSDPADRAQDRQSCAVPLIPVPRDQAFPRGRADERRVRHHRSMRKRLLAGPSCQAQRLA